VSVSDARFLAGFDGTERFAIAVAGDYVSICRRPADATCVGGDAQRLDLPGVWRGARQLDGTPPSIEVAFTGFKSITAQCPRRSGVDGDLSACPDATASSCPVPSANLG
jgi:hypothetical protein